MRRLVKGQEFSRMASLKPKTPPFLKRSQYVLETSAYEQDVHIFFMLLVSLMKETAKTC